MKDLTVANKIMAEIAAKNKNITPVSADDLPLFQEFFQKEPHTYGNSWTYVTQGVYGIGPNNLGYKYYDGKNLSTVCVYPKIEQPDLNVFYWIRPMGPTVVDVISESADVLLRKNIVTNIKKIFKNQFDSLIRKGFKDTFNFPWHSTSPLEDDTFPEQIINVKNSYEKIISLPRSNNIKRNFKKINNYSHKYEITINNDNFQTNAWYISRKFFLSKKRSKKVNLSSNDDYFNMIFANPARNSLIRKVAFIGSKPVGFYVVEKQNELYSSAYALICLKDKLQSVSDYLWLYIFQNITTPYLNAGGSEDEGIHYFKLKYFPEKEQKMYWATNYRS